MNKVPRNPDPRNATTSIIEPKRPSGGTTVTLRRPQQLPTPPQAQDQGTAVNPFSRAVHPRLQYPAHFHFLMRDLYDRGLVPEEWKIAAADEVRLDERGLEIEFTIVQPQQGLMRRIRVEVKDGKLVRVTH